MAEITIKDIAKECGVGVSTVSRALNNHPDINPETRRKIMEVIERTGFIPNNSARNLKRTDAKCIAMLVKGITNPFFSKMIEIIEDEAKRKRYALVLRHVEAQERLNWMWRWNWRRRSGCGGSYFWAVCSGIPRRNWIN